MQRKRRLAPPAPHLRSENNLEIRRRPEYELQRDAGVHGRFRPGIRFRITIAILAGSLWGGGIHAQTPLPLLAPAATTEPSGGADGQPDCGIIYLGFVGALEPPNNKYSGVVQIKDTLQGPGYPDVCANAFSPYVWTDGLDWLMKHFPAHAGVLTEAELKRAPKVILVGHSMGGWAIMSVARDLRSRDIPVELTIQVDSVGISDVTVPRNVKAGAIFHARDVLMLLTTKRIKLEDPLHTKILANVLVKGAGHESITRDPRIRELVMSTVDSLRATATTPASKSIE